MGILDSLPKWVRNNRFYRAELAPKMSSGGIVWKDDKRKEVGVEEANIISSHLTTIDGTDYHYVMLDLDVEAELIPSSTPGHSHLYINRILSRNDYLKLLLALRDAGIVENGIVKQMHTYKATTLRLPHIKKEFF